jgi:diacylglycerol kinase family enzyme
MRDIGATSNLCIIYNPTAGRGRAARRLERLRRGLGGRADFRPTHAVGQAEELARQAVLAGFPAVGAAGGDGTVHEVANGILQAGRPDVALAVFPLGSANDYAHSLGLDHDWWREPAALETARRVDVGWVRASTGAERYFVNGLGLGFNAAVTVESRRVRRLQGVALYGVALLRALYYHFTAPVLRLTIDGQPCEAPTLGLTVALGRREGNFILAPHALLDDGLFDYLHAGRLGRWEVLRFFPRMVTGRLPEHPQIRYGRCREVKVESPSPLTVHLDGELFCLPPDQVYGLEIRLLPGRLKVLGTPDS